MRRDGNGICALRRVSPKSFLARTQGEEEPTNQVGTALAGDLICWSLELGLPTSRP